MGKDDLTIASTTNTAEEIKEALQHGLDPDPDNAKTLLEEPPEKESKKGAEKPPEEDAKAEKPKADKKPEDAGTGDEESDVDDANEKAEKVALAEKDKPKDDDEKKPRKMDTRPRREDYQSDQDYEDAVIGHKAKKRIDKVTWEREEAHRRITALETEIADLKAAGKPSAKVEEKLEKAVADVVDPNEPKAEDFETHEQWLAALTKYTTRKAIDEDRNRRDQEDNARYIDEQHKQFLAAKPDAAARYDDFDEVIAANADMPISPAMDFVMKTSPVGHDIAYHLATHRAEATRIFKMVGPDQAIEMGRLLERIERRVESLGAPEAGAAEADAAADAAGDKSDDPPQKRKTAKATEAPEPLNPVGSRSTRTTQALEEMSLEDFKAKRRQDELLRRRNRR